MLLGLVIGTILADALGMADFHAVGEATMLGITTPFAFGYPVFEPVSCLAMTLVMLVTMAETTVLGGAGLAMFGMVAASGFQALSKAELHKKGNIMVVAISVAVALIPIGVPTFYSRFPTWVQIICNSGITIGSITAILLNLLLRDAPEPDEEKLPFRKSGKE